MAKPKGQVRYWFEPALAAAGAIAACLPAGRLKKISMLCTRHQVSAGFKDSLATIVI
jgi:hypothetical protein